MQRLWEAYADTTGEKRRKEQAYRMIDWKFLPNRTLVLAFKNVPVYSLSPASFTEFRERSWGGSPTKAQVSSRPDQDVVDNDSCNGTLQNQSHWRPKAAASGARIISSMQTVHGQARRC